MQYLLLIGMLIASQPLFAAHSEMPKTVPLEAAYQTASADTVLMPTNPLKTPKNYTETKSFPVVLTGYSSEPGQTDETPYITASGAYVREGIAAANFLPLGTAFRIPKLFGNQVFIVKDRMAERFSERIDIWFPAKDLAKHFGIKTAMIEVL